MTDIVEALRELSGTTDWPHPIFVEAATEIERLRAQGVHLADALYAGQQEIERLHTDYGILKDDYDAQRAEIEKLREEGSVELAKALLEINRLRETLQNIAIGGIGEDMWKANEIRNYAQDALKD